MNIKNLLLIALCLLSFFGSIYSQQRSNDLDGRDKDRRVDDRQMMTMIPAKTVVVENTAAITDKMHLSATENVDGKTGALADCVVFIE